MVLEITDEKFDEVLKSDKLVVVDFWAEWCGPCRMMSSIVDELAEDFADKCVVGKALPLGCSGCKDGVHRIGAVLGDGVKGKGGMRLPKFLAGVAENAAEHRAVLHMVTVNHHIVRRGKYVTVFLDI